MSIASTRARVAEIRRLVVSQQGFAPRFRRSTIDDVEATVRRLSAVQLDSITAVDRAHRLTLGSRIGSYPEGDVPRLLGEGRLFEYWAHEACLLPIELWPHFRRTMEGNGHWGIYDRALREHADLVEPVLERIRVEGPLGSRDFEGAARTTATCGTGSRPRWCSRRCGTAATSRLPRGRTSSARTTSPSASSRGAGSTRRRRRRTRRCARSRCSRSRGAARSRRRRSASTGGSRAARRGCTTICWRWSARAGCAKSSSTTAARRSTSCRTRISTAPGAPPTLVCPFDNLVWDRPLLERLFGFRHVIEVYKPEHERQFGYYVLPLLAGDRFVGRADLKADRAEGVLRVKRFTREPKVRGDVDAKLERAAARLARVLGLDRVAMP